MNARRVVRSLSWAIFTVLVAVSCARASPADPPGAALETLLADRPTLPRTWEELVPPRGVPPGPRKIDWQVEVSSHQIPPDSWCEEGAGELVRVWSDGGVQFGRPDVIHGLCRYSSPEAAADGFSNTTLSEAAGEDYWNFRYPDDVGSAAIYPQGSPGLPLHAEHWQIACGEGDAETVCAVWLWRAQYGALISEVQFRTTGGGITYDAFARLVVSVDEELVSKLE